MRDLRDAAESDDTGTSCSAYCERKKRRAQDLVETPAEPESLLSAISVLSLIAWQAYLCEISRRTRSGS